MGISEVRACVPPEACPGAPIPEIRDSFDDLAEEDRSRFIGDFLQASAGPNSTGVRCAHARCPSVTLRMLFDFLLYAKAPGVVGLRDVLQDRLPSARDPEVHSR